MLIFTTILYLLAVAVTALAPELWVSISDYPGVKRTAKDVAHDFGRITGRNGAVKVKECLTKSSKPLIIAGTVGDSELIADLLSRKKIDVSDIKGKWEAYTSVLVKSPVPGIPWALVIAGSNLRGTIYGLYDISETIGVSPWHWWADVAPKAKKNILVRDIQRVQKEPSVKFRGFFHQR